MKIYISGKITGLDREATLRKFENARQRFSSKDTVLIPTVLPDSSDLTHADYLHVCLAMIDICDAVYFLPDWVHSPGAQEELKYAREKNKKVIYASSEHIMEYVACNSGMSTRPTPDLPARVGDCMGGAFYFFKKFLKFFCKLTVDKIRKIRYIIKCKEKRRCTKISDT